MPDFQFRNYYIAAERLFDPRIKIPGRNVSFPKQLLPFKHISSIEDISSDIDVVLFADYFNKIVEFNNDSDFVEYIQSNSLYRVITEISDAVPRTQLIEKIITALKYPFALRRMLQGLVAEDSIYALHLPYLIESIHDLESSFLLIEYGYFKQSLQTLRNVIELTLAHAYFGLKGLDYHDLANSIDFRMPNFRGRKNSLITFLKEENLIDSVFENEIVNLYYSLSDAVHSQISKLNTTQNARSTENIDEWYENLLCTGEINLKLILRMIELGM